MGIGIAGRDLPPGAVVLLCTAVATRHRFEVSSRVVPVKKVQTEAQLRAADGRRTRDLRYEVLVWCMQKAEEAKNIVRAFVPLRW